MLRPRRLLEGTRLPPGGDAGEGRLRSEALAGATRSCLPPHRHDDYQDNYLPTGLAGGTAEDALDTACGLYLNDPTAWT